LSNGYETKRFSVVEEWSLDAGLQETSGLLCDDSGMYSINDSGNAPSLFSINSNGRLNEIPLPLKNKDWESVAASKTHFYIADIGNNNGKRKDLAIYSIDKKSKQKVSKIQLSYSDNVPSQNVGLAHDFDAEAITFNNNKLILFSKSWGTNVTRVYSLDINNKQQTVSPITFINGLPGMVTGADFNAEKEQYAVVGYEAGGLGFSVPYLAVLDKHFAVLDTYSLSGYGQVEAVCHYQDHLWFTQEKTPLKPAKLVKLKIE
jgi:hypothetical protein